MKKFLVTLVVILIAVSLGFGIFFLVRDNEVISIKSTSLYKDANQTFEIALDRFEVAGDNDLKNAADDQRTADETESHPCVRVVAQTVECDTQQEST